jgi:hypothetical protein
MPRERLPKSLRDMPDIVARELYKYRATSRGPARVFVHEYEASLRAAYKHRVAFSLHEIIFFFAKAAGSGVIGNFAYASIRKVVYALRRSRHELFGKNLEFDAVISRKTYRRLRRERYPEARPLRNVPATVEKDLQTEYRLMVSLVKNTKKRSKKGAQPGAPS